MKYSSHFLSNIQIPKERHSLQSLLRISKQHSALYKQTLMAVLLRFLHSPSLTRNFPTEQQQLTRTPLSNLNTYNYKHNLSHSVSIKTKRKGLMAYRGLPRARGELLLLRGVTQAGETARSQRRLARARKRELRVPKCEQSKFIVRYV